MRIAVFASGNGSNFQVIAEKMASQEIQGELVWLFCDQPEAFVLERAKQMQIPFDQFHPRDFENKVAYEEKILTMLQEKQIDMIILAGYMRLIGPTLLKAYPKKIINIHPALLPAFPGLYGILDAYEAGVETTGVTVHFVDEGMDTGPIIAQEKIAVPKNCTLAELETKIHAVEHVLYPKVIQTIIAEMEGK